MLIIFEFTIQSYGQNFILISNLEWEKLLKFLTSVLGAIKKSDSTLEQLNVIKILWKRSPGQESGKAEVCLGRKTFLIHLFMRSQERS